MAFTLPQFNLPVNIWRNANFWDGSTANVPTVPPDVTAVGNLSASHRTMAVGDFAGSEQWLLLPWGTDIRDGVRDNSAMWDLVEVPAGTGMWYWVAAVIFAGVGFQNQHIAAAISADGVFSPPQAVPYNSATPPVPPPPAVDQISQAFPFGPAPQGFSGPLVAGKFLLIVTTAQPVIVPLVTTSTLMGILPAAFDWAGPSGTNWQTHTYFYEINHPGGIDTFTFDTTTPSGIMATLYSVSANLDDVTGGPGNFTAVPLAAGLSGTTSGTNELLCAICTSAVGGIQGSWGGAYVQNPIADLSLFESTAGENYVQSVAFRPAPLAGDGGPFTWTIPTNPGFAGTFFCVGLS